MIVLDTNVLSELIRPIPAPAVVAWLQDQPRTGLFTTTISRGEMLLGVWSLPEGQRRRLLNDHVRAIFDQDMAGRILSFDANAADAFAAITVERRTQGRPISQFDAMIAGIARSRGARLATRNVRDFEGCGITMMDPWA
ncbi:MAG: type II toxin-antitoxin system VapC family toxin [Ahniella sp.]|nr:type II toxin-antitoxin system VapC family toxin [Ahniella sp.]